MTEQNGESIWDPVTEHIDELGRAYTFVQPPAREWLRLLPRLEEVNGLRAEDGTIPNEHWATLVDLQVDLVKTCVEEFRAVPTRADDLPLEPLTVLGNRVTERINAAQEYLDEQKKRSAVAQRGE